MHAIVVQLLSLLPSKPSLIDARSPAEFAGSRNMNRRPGHIPGAKNIDWVSLLDDKRRFLPPSLLLQRLGLGTSAKPSSSRPAIISYCQAGVRATVAFVALRLCGLKGRVYDGSMFEWSRRADAPLECTGHVK
jgi:thiosulfate/3-mercaptopyruvate sulfurtransferase